jgi:hypothetical protein
VGGLDHRPMDEPQSPCAPRSRWLWTSKLGDARMKGDPLWELLVAFIVGFIVEQLTVIQAPMRSLSAIGLSASCASACGLQMSRLRVTMLAAKRSAARLPLPRVCNEAIHE